METLGSKQNISSKDKKFQPPEHRVTRQLTLNDSQVKWWEPERFQAVVAERKKTEEIG